MLKLGYTVLIVVEVRLKVDRAYYCDLLLSNSCCLPYVSSSFNESQSETELENAVWMTYSVKEDSAGLDM